MRSFASQTHDESHDARAQRKQTRRNCRSVPARRSRQAKRCARTGARKAKGDDEAKTRVALAKGANTTKLIAFSAGFMPTIDSKSFQNSKLCCSSHKRIANKNIIDRIISNGLPAWVYLGWLPGIPGVVCLLAVLARRIKFRRRRLWPASLRTEFSGGINRQLTLSCPKLYLCQALRGASW
jgi:hypothetical protein